MVRNLVRSNQLNVSRFVIQCQLLPSHSPEIPCCPSKGVPSERLRLVKWFISHRLHTGACVNLVLLTYLLTIDVLHRILNIWLCIWFPSLPDGQTINLYIMKSDKIELMWFIRKAIVGADHLRCRHRFTWPLSSYKIVVNGDAADTTPDQLHGSPLFRAIICSNQLYSDALKRIIENIKQLLDNWELSLLL